MSNPHVDLKTLVTVFYNIYMQTHLDNNPGYVDTIWSDYTNKSEIYSHFTKLINEQKRIQDNINIFTQRLNSINAQIPFAERILGYIESASSREISNEDTASLVDDLKTTFPTCTPLRLLEQPIQEVKESGGEIRDGSGDVEDDEEPLVIS